MLRVLKKNHRKDRGQEERQRTEVLNPVPKCAIMAGMSVIADAFARRSGKAALLTFMTAGFPRADSTAGMLRAMADGGADILELGVPFSDPMADGPAIQRAGEAALQNGMTLTKTLEAAAQFRGGCSSPLVLMGYANSFFNFRDSGGDVSSTGVSAFAKAAGSAGANGLIVVDLADDDRREWREVLNAESVDMINLIAPTTTRERMQKLAEESQGFVYAISLKGVTGAAHIDADSARDYLSGVRAHASLPVAAGFGVRSVQQAKTMAQVADGVVVGSRLIEAAEKSDHPQQAVREATAELARALA